MDILKFSRDSLCALACSLALVFAFASEDATAAYRSRPICDPDIPRFDEALSKDAELRDLKSKVDESWRRLTVHGDPDTRAAGRAARYDWLCEIKAVCGTDVRSATVCLTTAFQQRATINANLLHQRDDAR